MKIIVQKFGGTSVANKETRKMCFEHIKGAVNNGYKVVVVVSAMGRKGDPYATDTLINMAPSINGREKDLLMITGELISASVFSSELKENDIESKVLTGGQAGILTNSSFNEASIIGLRPEKIMKEFEDVNVLVVTGFQGVTNDNEFTTLGRGGSDTSATALGAAVNADYVDIFTDVEGIMTADPRIVTEAKILEKVTYTEICNLAHMGAKVIHPRAVEIAMQYNTPIRVRSTFSKGEGTLITNQSELDLNGYVENKQYLTGITQTDAIVQFVITEPIENEKQNTMFYEFEKKSISLDLINITPGNIGFTVKNEDSDKVSCILDSLEMKFTKREDVTKISLVGAGMTGASGVVRKIVNTLYTNNISILQTSDSHTTIWVLVARENAKKAICLLHNTFCLSDIIVR
ncbi:aspartate kinase [Bacillus toyonensis]|uniref:aspartate kinase n=1 Tax=Bacillus toyonensis TaxID=155322 RepID=UPI002E2064A6|nr:aspartate kinase [Bacillus toyonensis]MED2737298.1 aspartate kinase [Bacillus toyonensis]